MRKDNDDVPIEEVTCKVETPKALLIANDDGDELGWFPISQICEGSEVRHQGDRGTLLVTAWIAEKKGL